MNGERDLTAVDGFGDVDRHAVELRLRGLIRTSRFVNEICVESANYLFQQMG